MDDRLCIGYTCDVCGVALGGDPDDPYAPFDIGITIWATQITYCYPCWLKVHGLEDVPIFQGNEEIDPPLRQLTLWEDTLE